MIPIVLLGKKDDNEIAQALRCVFPRFCGLTDSKNFFWEPEFPFFLLDSVSPDYLDAGGGIVIFKESFTLEDAPVHLLHANCIVPGSHQPACDFVRQSGLPMITCGGGFQTLNLSCMQEQTFLNLSCGLNTLNGSMIPAGEIPLNLPRHFSLYPTLCCGAVLLLLGKLN